MLNPIMLLGLFGLGIPVLIHLINRRRLPPVELATMRFVDGHDVANVFAPRPRDVLQLLLRLLLLLLFVLLMARPTQPSAEPSDRALILILDNSLSMQRQTPSGRMLFDEMRDQALELIDEMREADTAAVILVGDREFVSTGLIRDREVLARALSAAWPSDGGSRALLPAIRESVGALQGSPAPDRAVVVFSDLQRAALAEADAALQQHLATGRVRLALIGERLPETGNLAIERTAFSPAAVHIGDEAKLTAKVRNWMDREAVIELGMTVSTGQGESRRVVIAPGASVHVDLAHRFDLPVDTPVSAEVTAADALRADDRYHVPMRMRQRRQILLVAASAAQADAGLDRGYSGVDILGYAINPAAELGLAAATHTMVRRITPAALARVPLSMYSAVIFYGVDDLPEAQSRQDLRDYVTNGGGLWLIPARNAHVTTFHATFGDLLAGVRLGTLRESGAAAFVSRHEGTLGHALLAPLVRGEWGGLDQIPILRYRMVQHTGEALLALATRDGHPLAAVAEIGRGRVFVQLFDSDMRSSDLPRSPAFLPMVQTVTDYLAGGAVLPEPDVMRAGDTHYMHFPAYRDMGGEIEVQGPVTNRFALDEAGWARVSDLYVAGHYTVTHASLPGRRTRLLAVNPVTEESDLVQADDDELARVFGRTRVERIPFGALAAGFTHRRESRPWLLALLAGLLVIETLAGAWQARRRDVRARA